jgi:uncharacterized membrane protein YgcG
MGFRAFERRNSRWIAVAAALIAVAAVIVSTFIWTEARGTHDFQRASKPAVSRSNTSTALGEAISPLHFPELTGRVVDDARLLREGDELELTASLKALEDKNTDQVVVVTVPSLQDHSIEEYGLRLGNYWGIGTREKNNGVLLVVAPNERKVRIEVGRGLETVLTDKIAKSIVDTDIVPRFREGNYSAGIKDGVNAMIVFLSGNGIESESAFKLPIR